jgi:hypothetical protein
MKNQLTRMTSFGLAIALLTSAAFTAQAATPAQNQKFLNKLYQDLLSRTPNRVESATFTSLLGFGLTRTQVAGAITSSKEYRTDQIQQYFGAFLNRPATAGEANFFLNYMQQGATDDDVKATIFGGDEFYGFAGGTDHAFLNKLFENVLGRPVDRSAELTLETMLGHGATRQSVAALVLHSAEADQRMVTQLFQKLLNRLPQPAELAAFAQILQTGGKDEYVIDLLCGSDEYFQLVLAQK